MFELQGNKIAIHNGRYKRTINAGDQSKAIVDKLYTIVNLAGDNKIPVSCCFGSASGGGTAYTQLYFGNHGDQVYGSINIRGVRKIKTVRPFVHEEGQDQADILGMLDLSIQQLKTAIKAARGIKFVVA